MNKRKKLFTFILITLLLIANNIIAFADDIQLPEPSREFYVYDEVGVIDNSSKDYIIGINEQLYSKTGAQIVVAVVNSLQDRDIDEYANLLFRKWGIGSKEKNNGVLLLVAMTDRKVRIEVGYGLEGALPDGKAGEILDNDIIPYFQQGNYNDGILKGFISILSVVENEYNIDIETEGNTGYSTETDIEDKGPSDTVKKILIAIGVVIFLIIDFRFFGGFLTYSLIRTLGRGGGSRGNRGGGGSSGGGGAGRGW